MTSSKARLTSRMTFFLKHNLCAYMCVLTNVCAKDPKECLVEFVPTKVPYSLLAERPGHDAAPQLDRPRCPFITLHSRPRRPRGPCIFTMPLKYLSAHSRIKNCRKQKDSEFGLHRKKKSAASDRFAPGICEHSSKCVNLKRSAMAYRPRTQMQENVC